MLSLGGSVAAKITETAQLSPGRCLVSGDYNGPFIDTGQSFRGYGRVVLAVKAIAPLMRELGWVPLEEVEAQRAEAQSLREKVTEIEDKAEAYDSMLKSLEPFLPEREVVTREVATFKDTQVRKTNERLSEENRELRKRLHELETAAKAQAKPEQTEETEEETETTPDLGTAEVKGQQVDLGKLLSEPIDTIVSVVTRTPELIEPVLEAEKARAEAAGKRPRVTLRSRLEELR